MKKLIPIAYITLLSIFSGAIITAQLLGFLNLYYPFLVYFFTILLAGVFGYLLWKFTFLYIFESIDRPNQIVSTDTTKKRIIIFASIILFVVVLFLPLLFWPFTRINHELNWDSGFYHLTKAAELVVSHSSWDLTIPYGEYPFGFESLIALSFLISPSGYVIGCVHALITLFFTLSLFLLVNRYVRIPSESSLFLVIAIIASYDILRFTNLNPFMILRVLAFTIGKNDFFLSALIIAFIFFSPIGPDYPKFNFLGLGLLSSLICATKPNGFLLLAFVWLLVLSLQINQRKNNSSKKDDFRIWGGIIIVHVSCLFWLIRNILVQNAMFSENLLEIQKNSIYENLFNPLFLNSLGFIPLMILAVLIISSFASIFIKRIHYSIPLLFGILNLTFIITPATLYFGASGNENATIFWRLGLFLLVYEIPIFMILLDPVLIKILSLKSRKIKQLINVTITTFTVAIAIIASYQNYPRLIFDTTHTIVLRDQYVRPVGVDGYYSAYDYIRKNVTNSVIWIDNGLPFYLYGDKITNSVTRSHMADYQVFLQTNWNGRYGYPSTLTTPEWNKKWILVYEDPEGRVYRHR